MPPPRPQLIGDNHPMYTLDDERLDWRFSRKLNAIEFRHGSLIIQCLATLFNLAPFNRLKKKENGTRRRRIERRERENDRWRRRKDAKNKRMKKSSLSWPMVCRPFTRRRHALPDADAVAEQNGDPPQSNVYRDEELFAYSSTSTGGAAAAWRAMGFQV